MAATARRTRRPRVASAGEVTMACKPIFRLTALSAALASGAVWAADEEDPVKQMTRPDSAIAAGIGYWNHYRPRLRTYDGMREQGAYGLLDALIVTRDGAGQG